MKEEILPVRFLSYIKLCCRGHLVGSAECVSRWIRLFRVLKHLGGVRRCTLRQLWAPALWLKSVYHSGPTYLRPGVSAVWGKPSVPHVLFPGGCSSLSLGQFLRGGSWWNEGWSVEGGHLESKPSGSSHDTDLQHVNVPARLHFKQLHSVLAVSPRVSQQTGVSQNPLPLSHDTSIKIC